jgi:ATP-dependent helicase Lhr and Lhr-like helicase
VTVGFDALNPAIQHHIVNSLGWPALRPLQEEAIAPLMRGEDALLLAPTAGGKTEAAVFPMLSRMAAQDWRGTSMLYLCPLRALLNNLEPRVSGYAHWLGREASVRHGDTGQMARRRQLIERPDILLTTPESLESILVSATIDPHVVLADVRAVIIDEVHAFAGDDRGWHLLAVLERLTRLTGRPLQRIGLSATIGNPEALLTWLQGSGAGQRPGVVIAPDAEATQRSEIGLDYVGSIANAARIIATLHRGEKRLVFADSRRTVEQLAVQLSDHEVETFVSHSSLSAAERRRAETAFAEARDCVVVSTSTLELGIDVGDLDRVLQVGAPGTVASLLQRLGRTGRRPGSVRNMLLLSVDDTELLRGAGLALLWSEGYVEPIVPPPSPHHLAAQQLLALALQEGRVGRDTWPEWLNGLPVSSPELLVTITDWLVETGHLDIDTDMLFIGPQAERAYGRRHFMELMSVFTSDPQVTVLHGRDEIGTVDPLVLLSRVEGPRILALAGRSWKVTSVNWTRRQAYVEPGEGKGLARWIGSAAPRSFALTDAMRRVLLGADPVGVQLSRRAEEHLSAMREEWEPRVDAEGTVVLRDGDEVRWWTWAGSRGNAVLHAALNAVSPQLLDPDGMFDNEHIAFAKDAGSVELRQALGEAFVRFGKDLAGVQPVVSKRAIEGLKFSDLLPPGLAEETLSSRLADFSAALSASSRPTSQRAG